MGTLYHNALTGHSGLFEKRLSILQDISSTLVAADNISTIGNLMLDLAVNYTNAEKGSLMLMNETDELYILAARGIDIQLFRTCRVKVGEGIAGTVAEVRTPVLVEALEKDGRFKAEERNGRYKTTSFISCPVMSRNRLLGIININDKRDRMPFTEEEFTLVKIIASQAAIPLENTFLMSQLRAKAAELEDINSKLIETDVMKTEFLTRISHELRTPLNSIKGAVYHLQHSGKMGRDEQKEFYGIISNETGKLTGTIENLLDFLRAEDELKIAKKSFINIAEVIREAANSKALRSTLEKKGLKLVVDIREGISDTAGNKIRATQFFLNLIEVLSSYLERDDVIRVSVYESEAMRVALTFPRRMPEAVTSLLQNSAPKSLFHAEQSEEKLKMHLAGKVAEVHRWNISTGNVNNSFVVSLAIPRNARQRIETVTDAAMGMFLELIAALLGLDTSSIMLIDEFTGELTIKSARGLDEDIVRRARVTVGEGIAGWVALEGKPLLIGDIEGDPGFGRRNAPGYNTKSLLSLPIKIGDKVAGVLNLNNKRTTETFSARDLHIGVALSERISYFMERLYSGKYREDDYKRFMASFDGLLYAVRKYHKKEAAFPILGEKIMDRLGKKEEETRLALYTLLLYDLGLMLLDESLLRKKGLLPSEVRTLKIHPYGTIDLIRDFEFSERVKEAILHHHERYDGTGYPDALSGNDIPLISRIICVVDAFCAMIEERPYRRARAKDEALLELRKGAGTIYDPEIVKALEDIYKTSLPDGL